MINEKKIKITVETLEPLRIGTKKDPLSAADNPVARVGGKLVIPGSTLKGALRAELERFLIDAYFVNGRWKTGYEHFQPCIPGAELSKDEEKLVKLGKYRDQNGACRYPCTEKQCGKDRDNKIILHSICPVCYLLGAMGLNGFLRIPFLYAETSTTELYSARIDRATKTVASGTNRPYELVPDGTTFSGVGTLLIEDTILKWKLGEPRELAGDTLGDMWLKEGKLETKTMDDFIQKFIVERLKSINIIGGYKSKGLGAIKVSVDLE